MLQRALSKAKREGGKKVPINFQVPGELKEQFEELCKKNGVSITSMLTGLMETAIEEAQGIYYEVDASSLLSLHNRMKEINNDLEAFYQHYGFPFDPAKVEDKHYFDFKNLIDEKERINHIIKMSGGLNHDSDH